MIALLKQIPSEAKIRTELRRLCFGANLHCPRCHSRRVYRSETRYRCRRCRRPFTLLTGTWLEGAKIALRTVWGVLWCYTQQVPVRQTQKLCHLNEQTVRHWFRTFRLHIPMVEPILEGTVQLDEAYFKNTALMLAKQVGTSNLAYTVFAKRVLDKRDAARFLFQSVAPRSRLQTDGAGIYRGIDRWWPVAHRTDIHRKWEFALTSEIEGAFGNLRTFIRRMYHHVRPEQLPEYVTEFCARFCSPETFDSPRTFLQKTLCTVPTAT